MGKGGENRGRSGWRAFLEANVHRRLNWHTQLAGVSQVLVHHRMSHGRLYAFGNRSGPRPPRPGIDLAVDANGMVHPTDPPTGASLYADPAQAPLTGHYHGFPADSPLPQGVKITPDGVDVGGPHPPTHHMFSPTESMPFGEFVGKLLGLPWSYGSKK
jgi:hypothetical protein